MSDFFFIGSRQSDAGLTAAVVGNKGANLARLDMLGLRVPPAVVLGTALSREYMQRGQLPDDFTRRLTASVRLIENATGLLLGGRHPLVLSVRSSPPSSMPGMLETVLNVGLNEQAVHGLIRRTGNPWLAWDAYRRLVRSFGSVVAGIDDTRFDQLERQWLSSAQTTAIDELDPISLRNMTGELAGLLQANHGDRLPGDPMAQVVRAVEAVLRSWHSPKAQAYRLMNGIDEETGTAVVIQAMAFGNAGPRSGSGVGFTRNPATGDDELYVDFVFNAQGEDDVSGRYPVTDSQLLPEVLPEVYCDLRTAKVTLEREFRDMQDFEFTVEEGQLFFLQTRTAKRTPWAALRVATDLVRDRLIEPALALRRLETYDLKRITRTVICPDAATTAVTAGTPAGSGVGVGVGAVVVSAARAQQLAADIPVILARPDLTTDDFAGLAAAAGLLTTFGGRTAHAAVVARQLGKPCVVGCQDLHVDAAARACWIGEQSFHEGDVITIDGDTGLVYAGSVPVVTESPADLLEIVDGWRSARLR
jgi:pyruvate, orthophosphate dikinase